MNIRTLISPACSGHRNSDSFDGFRRSFYRLLIGHVAVTSSTVASVPLSPSLLVLSCADRSPRRTVRAAARCEPHKSERPPIWAPADGRRRHHVITGGPCSAPWRIETSGPVVKIQSIALFRGRCVYVSKSQELPGATSI